MPFFQRRLLGQGALALLFLLLDSSLSAYAQIFRRLDFESPFSILSAPLNGESCINMQSSTSWKLTNGQRNYYTQCKGRPNQPWISGKHYCKGRRSVAFQYPNNSEHPASDLSQKVEFWYNYQTFGQPWWIGFAIKVGSGRGDANRFESPPSKADWVILTQWWQGGGSIPPMRLVVEPTGIKSQLNWHLAISNSSNTKQAAPGNGFVVTSGPTVPFRGTIRKGKWNTFVLGATFRTPESGKPGGVRMWQNRLPVKVANSRATVWNGYVGFDIKPTSTYKPPDTLFKDLGFKQGIYRQVQARHQTVFFDQLSIFNGVDGLKKVQPGNCLNGR
jgi:hypothetical protein